MARLVLGVAGGIAAYKSCELLRLLTEAGHRVRVVPTDAALRFVGAPTWEALSGEPAATDVFDDATHVPHVRLGREAELVLVAPATADLLARAVQGRADDLLTSTLLTTRAPVLYAPAMHTEMWEHPATVANVATLRARGALVVDPAVGRLTGADSGRGRLPEPEALAALAERVLARPEHTADLAGRRVVVTAGGTREPVDPVRFLGNRSSGKQGHALARAAVARGASVVLVTANVAAPPPAGVVQTVPVETTEQLRAATLAAAAEADAVVMAAAPCDFRPTHTAAEKIKKADDGGDWALPLTATPDIAAELGSSRPAGQVLVVFAAETTAGPDAEAHAVAKLRRKNADLVVLNTVGGGTGAEVFGADDTSATVLDIAGVRTAVPAASKDELAETVWDLVKPRLPSRTME